jgi:hypothetical protein
VDTLFLEQVAEPGPEEVVVVDEEDSRGRKIVLDFSVEVGQSKYREVGPGDKFYP